MRSRRQEFALAHEEMSGLGIGTEYRGLPPFPAWSRYDKKRQFHEVDNNRAHNRSRIAEAKAAAEAPRPAAASEAGSSQAGSSVRDRSNTRSPLAILTTRCLAQSAGTLAGLPRWWGVARATASSLMARAVMQVLPSISPAHILAKVRRAARPDEAARGLPHRVQQEGQFLRSCVGGWVLIACRASRARFGRRVCRTSAPPRLPV